MTTLSGFVLRHKRLVGLFWLAVLVAGLAASSHVSNRLSTSEFALPGKKSYQAAVTITRLYGNGGNAKPLVPGPRRHPAGRHDRRLPRRQAGARPLVRHGRADRRGAGRLLRRHR